MSEADIISFKGLTFTYLKRVAPTLQGIYCTVKKGEFLLISGPTGCGKSTLLKTLNGLIPHGSAGEMEGEVMVCGMDFRKTPMRELTRRVGMVFQNPDDQLFATTVEDEVAFGPESLCLAREQIGRGIDRSLAFVGLQGSCRSYTLRRGKAKGRHRLGACNGTRGPGAR